MKNKMMTSLGTLAVSATLVGLGATASNAADCIPSDGTPEVIGTWHRASFTDWSTDSTTPADPDGQSGEDNLLNTVQIGEDYSQTAPGSTKDSGWVTAPPSGSGWTLAETNTVSNEDGSTETITGTPGQWWNFSPNRDKGPLQGEPAFPSDPRGTWQGPHTEDGPGQDESGTFQMGNGNGTWFHRDPGTADEVVEHPPTTHEEYRYERTTPGTTEYRWSVYKRTNTEGTDPVTCDPDTEEPGVEQPPTEQPPVKQPSVKQGPNGQAPTGLPPAEHEQPKGEPRGESPAHLSVPAPRSRPAAAVPTVIDAGL